MHLVVVGLNHRTAPIELRERLSVPEHRLPEALLALAARPEVAETALLSTCNRLEVYASVPHTVHGAALIRHLSEYHGLPETDFADHLYRHHDDDAVRQLFRVAAGLDSLVLGEGQILRQVRDGYDAAVQSGNAGSLLHGLFQAALRTGRRARAETQIGAGGFSIGHAAVDLAESIFGSLAHATVLILGAGKMSELTARHLVASGVSLVLVANRTHDRAVALAQRLGGRAIRYDTLEDELVRADVVISSTSAPHHILDRAILAPIVRRRRGRPLFLVDIAVPRDVAPDVGELDNVFLYDVDDLEEVVADMALERAGEVAKVEALIDEEVAGFAAWRRSLEAAPIVAQLKAKHEEIRRSELDRLRNQLPDLPDHAWTRIEAATRSLVNRISRDPVEQVKQSALDTAADAPSLIDAARTLFALDEEPCPTHRAPHDAIATSPEPPELAAAEPETMR